MPTNYQVRCDCCGYASDVFHAEYAAVFVDKPPVGAAGSVVAGAVLHGTAGEAGPAEQSDPRLVVLAQPFAHHPFGLTGLALTGRYVRVRRVVCRDCGTLFEVRRLTWPLEGSVVISGFLGMVFVLAAGVWWQNFWLGFQTMSGIVAGCMAVVSVAGWAYTWVRFRERARELDGPRNCPRCGSGRYAGAETRRVFPCPQCSQRSMRGQSVGKSSVVKIVLIAAIMIAVLAGVVQRLFRGRW